MTESNNRGPFGPDEMEWFTREATDGLRRMVGQFVENQLRERPTRPAPPEPSTSVETPSDGVWAIVIDGRVETVYATELDALRANKDNVDPTRTVRFLPFGEPV